MPPSAAALLTRVSSGNGLGLHHQSGASSLSLPASVKKEILQLLHDQGIDCDEPRGEHLLAVVKCVTKRLVETTHSIDAASTMVSVQEVLARVCEYADMLVQACFGPTATVNNDKVAEDMSVLVIDASEEVEVPNSECVDAVTTPAMLVSPVESQEIWRSDIPKDCTATCTAPDLDVNIAPFDQVFERLQDELRRLAEQGTALRARFQALITQNDETNTLLDKIEARLYHRLDRARTRHIRFVAQLEEVWLQHPEALEAKKMPCAACTKERNTKPPPLKQPSPLPGTAIKK